MRKTVKLTARRERALKRLETRLSGVRKVTEKDYIGIGMTDPAIRKAYMEDYPFAFVDEFKHPVFYAEEDLDRMKKEIDTLKARI